MFQILSYTFHIGAWPKASRQATQLNRRKPGGRLTAIDVIDVVVRSLRASRPLDRRPRVLNGLTICGFYSSKMVLKVRLSRSCCPATPCLPETKPIRALRPLASRTACPRCLSTWASYANCHRLARHPARPRRLRVSLFASRADEPAPTEAQFDFANILKVRHFLNPSRFP